MFVCLLTHNIRLMSSYYLPSLGSHISELWAQHPPGGKCPSRRAVASGGRCLNDRAVIYIIIDYSVADNGWNPRQVCMSSLSHISVMYFSFVSPERFGCFVAELFWRELRRFFTILLPTYPWLSFLVLAYPEIPLLIRVLAHAPCNPCFFKALLIIAFVACLSLQGWVGPSGTATLSLDSAPRLHLCAGSMCIRSERSLHMPSLIVICYPALIECRYSYQGLTFDSECQHRVFQVNEQILDQPHHSMYTFHSGFFGGAGPSTNAPAYPTIHSPPEGRTQYYLINAEKLWCFWMLWRNS